MARPGRFVSCGPGVAFLLFATACLGSEPDQAARRWPINLQATLGYHYSTGKYGTSERTDMSYIPLTLRAAWRDWSLAATIPYIRIDGSAATVIEGENGPVLSGDADGLGDVLAGLSYLLFPPRDWLPFLELGTRIKFPTANEDEGLGTGEFDYARFAEVSRVFGRVTPFLSVGYRFLGEPSGFDLNDVWLASLGSVYTLSESVDAGLFLYPASNLCHRVFGNLVCTFYDILFQVGPFLPQPVPFLNSPELCVVESCLILKAHLLP